MNGFEDDFVPKGNTFVSRRKKARQAMLNLANKLLGTNLTDETLIVGTSGVMNSRTRYQRLSGILEPADPRQESEA